MTADIPARTDADIEALIAAATPGPWSCYLGDLWCGVTAEELARADWLSAEFVYSNVPKDIFKRAERPFHGNVKRPEDAEFIAAARDLVPSLLARAQKAEARVSELTADCDACVSCEGDTLSPDGFCARCKMADDAEEIDLLSAELAEAKLGKDYLYGRTLDLGDERDRLSAQVAAVRALLDEYTEQSLYGESCVTHDRLRAALDGTGHDEPSEGEQ